MTVRFFENSQQTEALMLTETPTEITVKWVTNGKTQLDWTRSIQSNGTKETTRCTGVLADLMELHNITGTDRDERLAEAVSDMQYTLTEQTIVSEGLLHAPPSEGSFGL